MTNKELRALLESGLINWSELARRTHPYNKNTYALYSKKLREQQGQRMLPQDFRNIRAVLSEFGICNKPKANPFIDETI